MKKLSNRFLALFMALVMCLSLGTTAFASGSQPEEKGAYYNLELTSDGITSITDENGNTISAVQPRSSISGYKQSTLTARSDGSAVLLQVMTPNPVGYGGMGITIKASSSWNGYMSLDVLNSTGQTTCSNRSVKSNGETVINNLWHWGNTYFNFFFSGIPQGQSVSVQIWIYG